MNEILTVDEGELRRLLRRSIDVVRVEGGSQSAYCPNGPLKREGKGHARRDPGGRGKITRHWPWFTMVLFVPPSPARRSTPVPEMAVALISRPLRRPRGSARMARYSCRYIRPSSNGQAATQLFPRPPPPSPTTPASLAARPCTQTLSKHSAGRPTRFLPTAPLQRLGRKRRLFTRTPVMTSRTPS